jgi:hypothetical protein
MADHGHRARRHQQCLRGGRLDAAIKRWVEVLHVGPFFRLDGVRSRIWSIARPAEAEPSLALNSGGVQIELIAQPAPPLDLSEREHAYLAVLARD